MSLDFLLEVGTEEIPHWMIPSALDQLSKLNLFGATPRVDATPRRLVVRAASLPERTPDREQLVKGPPLTAGDKAAEGFAKKQGADPSALRKAGNYYELVKKVEGRPVRDIHARSAGCTVAGTLALRRQRWHLDPASGQRRSELYAAERVQPLVVRRMGLRSGGRRDRAPLYICRCKAIDAYATFGRAADRFPSIFSSNRTCVDSL